MKVFSCTFLLGSLLFGLLACGGASGERQEAVETILPDEEATVTVFPLAEVDFQHELISNGKLAAKRRVDLRFESPELIAHIYVKNGDRVRKGMKLAELDGFKLQNQVDQALDALEKSKLEVQDVLTPRVDVVAVSDGDSLEEVADVFMESGYSRLPVYHETIDNIIGVVHEKDLFAARRAGKTRLEEMIGPTLYTTGTTQISALLRTLRESKHHMAVVVDEYGGTEGIVTLEDILEELVGEIWDEHDDVIQEIRPQSDGSWLVSGDAGVDDVCEELAVGEESESVAVSGLVQEKLSGLPRVGDRFDWGRYEGTVTRVSHRRVLEVRLCKKPEARPDKPDRGERSVWARRAAERADRMDRQE